MKTGGAMHRGGGLDGHRVDLRARRSAAQCTFDTIDRCLVSLDERFDAAVRRVTHVSMHPFDRSRILREHTKPYALYTTTDEKPARDDHRKEGLYARGNCELRIVN